MDKHTVVPPGIILAVIFCLQTVNVYGQRFVIEPSNSTVSKGSTVILECRVADFQGQVQWAWEDLMLGPDVDIPSFSRYSMVGNQATGEYDLMISNADLEDDALFECQMMSSLGFPGKRSRKAKVDVLVPPDEPIIDGTPKVEVIVNQPTNITCHANHGKPAATITWLINNEPVTGNIVHSSVTVADGKRKNATSILAFTAKKTDQGKTVECRAINAAIHNHKWTRGELEVLFPPEVSLTVTPSKKQLKEGDRVKFSCEAVANPSAVTWKWYQDEEELVGATSSTLELTSVGREHHKKTISCEGTNRVGKSKQSFPLNVEYGPKFTSDAVHVEVDKGKDATLECTVDANPAATIYWKKHGSDRILSSASSYRILSVAEADFGAYTCTATVVSRGFQEISRDVYLLKKGPPVIVSDDAQYAKFGETGKVECDMKAVPKPSTVAWTHNGKPLELEKKDRYEVKSYHTIGGYKSTLWIASVQDGDFGNYNCTVTNGYGTDMLVINFKEKDAIPIAFILVGVLLGVVLIIAITIVVFLYHRKKSSASDAGSQDSDASITKKKKDGSPEIKVEYSDSVYGSPVDNWKPEFDQKLSRYSAEYDELKYPSKEHRPMNGYAPPPDMPDGYYGYNQDFRNNPYGTFPGAAASRAYPIENRYDPTYGTARPTYGSDYGTYRAALPPPSRQSMDNYGPLPGPHGTAPLPGPHGQPSSLILPGGRPGMSSPNGPPSVSSHHTQPYVPGPPSVASSRLSTNV